ncbi:MAG: tRNA uridine-5-carboxymethylaminomethyl(34) synthesis enzyme MnmG [Deltaproteobacteria bacterium]|nr:tRNA uridine-5-carboxymethylaminomethyl(34) synthesis enzyme MnmG [Deltaproteobacteria bacterium]MBN2670065.1 tRNA uridine-5-carboxymethylaminomethyl(34) synthesis enzyme MnmG [Deltaproteobacteria bacterium]
MESKKTKYDVVVIGGGHAGCEAYAASCRLHVKTALVVPSFNTVGVQPCNPAVGGPGKGHLVREIVALGGVMGIVTDRSGIQFRTLNRTKGPAVRSTRVQTDSQVYVENMMSILKNYNEHGSIIEDFAMGLAFDTNHGKRKVTGVYLKKQGFIPCGSVVITTGTFLRGMLFIGDELTPGGRRGAEPSVALAQSLEDAGLPLMRLKTGTCPRLAGDSIDTSRLEEQFGDEPAPFFDPDTTDYALPQRSCFLTYTDDNTHRVIEQNLHKSAMYSGSISGIGPRYCPSIETKIERFPEKERHQIFLEPEDKDGKTIYPAGISTSFPRDVQLEMVHAIPGLENARIVKWGYAVEYDAVEPQALTPHLEVDNFEGLFLAGQILGTSGYEEAGALGLIAGANAALKQKSVAPIVFKRNEAYLGVMIDDLTGTGVDEPYRMFTSRAEYRLLLREDNADERLLNEALRSGLISYAQATKTRQTLTRMDDALNRLQQTVLTPNSETNQRLNDAGLSEIKKPTRLLDLVRRESNNLARVAPVAPWVAEIDDKTATRLEVKIKYEGYLARQEAQAKRLHEIDTIHLPGEMNYDGIPGLRGEIIEKLKRSRPATLGQVSRIPGVTPAAVEILRVYIQRHNQQRAQAADTNDT